MGNEFHALHKRQPVSDLPRGGLVPVFVEWGVPVLPFTDEERFWVPRTICRTEWRVHLPPFNTGVRLPLGLHGAQVYTRSRETPC